MLCVMPHADPSRTLQPKPKPAMGGYDIESVPAAGITIPFEYFRRHIYVTVATAGQAGIHL